MYYFISFVHIFPEKSKHFPSQRKYSSKSERFVAKWTKNINAFMNHPRSLLFLHKSEELSVFLPFSCICWQAHLLTGHYQIRRTRNLENLFISVIASATTNKSTNLTMNIGDGANGWEQQTWRWNVVFMASAVRPVDMVRSELLEKCRYLCWNLKVLESEWNGPRIDF